MERSIAESPTRIEGDPGTITNRGPFAGSHLRLIFRQRLTAQTHHALAFAPAG